MSKNCISLLFSGIEIAVSTNKEIKTKTRCFKKKKYVSLFIFSPATGEVEEKEKKDLKIKEK